MSEQLIEVLKNTIVALVRRAGPDLSARQLGVFLTCYLQDGAHTVRGLAAELDVSKPAVTRALDRLGELDLARRKVDPLDRRSVLVQRTLQGAAFLRELRSVLAESSAPVRDSPTSDQLIGVLKNTVVALVRRAGPDLSARQLGVFLTCYLQDGAHTVRGLAAELHVSKPAVTRALDRLGELGLARRKVDPLDRRSVLVQRTLQGAAFLRELLSILVESSASMRKEQIAAHRIARA